jgi:hypothetical protein
VSQVEPHVPCPGATAQRSARSNPHAACGSRQRNPARRVLPAAACWQVAVMHDIAAAAAIDACAKWQ